MKTFLVASLLVLGFTGVTAFASDQAHLTYIANGHPDPCWPLRLKRHRSMADESRFQACLARHNWNN